MFFYDEAFKASGIVLTGFKTGELLGRAADNGVSLPWVANMAVSAGAGDHVEIGTLYGASAMTVATAKAMAGLSGTVYCIDPWDDRKTTEVCAMSPKIENDLSAKFEDVQENVSRLNAMLEKNGIPRVSIELIKAKSQPWPHKLDDKRFVSAFIDGLHYGDVPKLDFGECAKRTTHYIGFDNYEESYPEIEMAVNDAIATKNGKAPDWSLYFKNFVFVALRRWQPPRGVRLATDLGHL